MLDLMVDFPVAQVLPLEDEGLPHKVVRSIVEVLGCKSGAVYRLIACKLQNCVS